MPLFETFKKSCLHIARAWYSQGASAQPAAKRLRGRQVPVTVYIQPPDGSDRKVPVVLNRHKMWSPEEVQRLKGVALARTTRGKRLCDKDWQEIAKEFPGRLASGCKQKYAKVTSAERKGSLGADAKFAAPKTKWSRYDETMLMSMREVSRRHGWADIVKALGKFTVKECETRYAVMRNRQRSIQKRGAAAIINNTGRTSAFRHVPERNPDDPPKLWGLAEDLKLMELLEERGEFDFIEFQKYIPEFGQSSMYNALDRILCYPAHATGNWTPSENAALSKLVHMHGADWKRISEEMPTGRSSVQCRSHYTTQIARPVLTQRRWSDEEVRQLELLVNLNTRTVYVDNSTQQPMLDKETNVLLKLVSDSTTISSKLSGLLQALGQDMGNSSEIDALILKQTEGNEQAAKRAIRKIDWPLIASYLMPRTPLQCSIKWARVQYAKLEAQDMYWGPWTREEDAQLYELYCRAPGKWVWISEKLARPRSHFLAKKRYVYYVGRYINMLKACKGPDWDPVADQLEEVHMRCEISAWYTQRLEGYRPQDPYPCPYNVDLTGYGQYIKKQYTFR